MRISHLGDDSHQRLWRTGDCSRRRKAFKSPADWEPVFVDTASAEQESLDRFSCQMDLGGYFIHRY